MNKDRDDVFRGNGAPKSSAAYSGMFNGIGSSNMSKELAFATVLAGAVYADDKVRRVEIQEMKALANRTHTMAEFDRQKRDEIYQTAISSVEKRERLLDSVANACNRLVEAENKDSPGICLSVYAHACDLIFSDHKVPDAERRYIKFLIDKLELNVDEAQSMLNGIQLKNEV